MLISICICFRMVYGIFNFFIFNRKYDFTVFNVCMNLFWLKKKYAFFRDYVSVNEESFPSLNTIVCIF